MPNAVLDATRKKRAKTQDKIDAVLAVASTEKRTLTDEEGASFDELAAKAEKLDKQIRVLEKEEARAEKAAKAAADAGLGEEGSEGRVTNMRSPMTYEQYGRNGYFRDLGTIAQSMAEPVDPEPARRRLFQHAKEIEIESRTNPVLERMLREVRSTPDSIAQSDFEARVNPNTTAGTGGEFVPPLWLVAMYVPFVRPGRVCANRVRTLPLPPGIDIINLPKIKTGAITAIQTAQQAAVASQDIATSTVSAAVNTIAGQEDLSMQLLEQSPLAMDQVIFDDLGRDYDQRLDIQIIAGSGTNGQHKGVLNVAGATSNSDITKANQVTVASTVFHDGSTSGTQYRSLWNGINQIETLRVDTPTAIWLHPRRSNSWAYSAVDSNNRPLFIPNKYGPFNVVGTNEVVPVPQGFAGEVAGLPVIKDANVPTTMSGTATSGGSADAIVILKEDDLILWEGTMRMRALPEILSGTLQIRFQLYAYSAFMPDRYAPSISQLTGNTGLATPGF